MDRQTIDAAAFQKSFAVTDAARDQILFTVGTRSLTREVVCLMKARRDGLPAWGVAFQEQGQISEEEISVISGIRMYVDPSLRAELSGRSLDFEGGRFQLV